MQRTASPDTSDAGIEQYLAALGKTAPRITGGDIEANIAGVYYFTADDGLAGAHLARHGHLSKMGDAHEGLRLVTFCVLILRNGHRIVGVNSGPVSAENFDAEIGRKLARANAIEQCWPLLGYELRTRLAAEAEANVTPADAPHQARVKVEYYELAQREGKLRAFLADPVKNKALPAAERERMQRQAVAQNALAAILAERIAAFSA